MLNVADNRPGLAVEYRRDHGAERVDFVAAGGDGLAEPDRNGTHVETPFSNRVVMSVAKPG